MTASARHYARLGVVQYLYAWECGRSSIDEEDGHLLLDADVVKFGDLAYFQRLSTAILERVSGLDDLIDQAIERSLDQVDPVARAILRLGTYELLTQPEVPPKVVVHECIALAHELGGDSSYRFVNGVLDKLAFGSDSIVGSREAKRLAPDSRSEFDLIKEFFNGLGVERDDVVAGIGDDGAVLEIPPTKQVVVSTDTLNAGVHFAAGAAADDVGHKSLAVSLSDLAAMGAAPSHATLSLSLPKRDEDWLDGFSQAFRELAVDYGVALIGGDTVRGPLSVNVTIFGLVEAGKWLSRSGAKAGDGIYVTGTLGDAALGLKVESGEFEMNAEQAAHFSQRLSRPEPRVNAGVAIANLASAAIDISDGLVADLGHVLEASGVGGEIVLEKIPLSIHYRAFVPNVGRELALTHGDDYELCFTMADSQAEELAAIERQAAVSVTRIGTVTEGAGLAVLDESGDSVEMRATGYRHF